MMPYYAWFTFLAVFALSLSWASWYLRRAAAMRARSSYLPLAGAQQSGPSSLTPEEEPVTLPLPTTSARGNRANWFFALLVAGLGATVFSLALSVVVLAESVRASARLERDWQAETIQQERLKFARQFEARQLTENLMRLREFSRTLDKIGAE